MTVTGYLFAEGYLAHGEPEEWKSVDDAWNEYWVHRSLYYGVPDYALQFVECDEQEVFAVHWLRGDPQEHTRVLNVMLAQAWASLVQAPESTMELSPDAVAVLRAKLNTLRHGGNHESARAWASLTDEQAEELAVIYMSALQDVPMKTDSSHGTPDDMIAIAQWYGENESYLHVTKCACGRVTLEDS